MRIKLICICLFFYHATHGQTVAFTSSNLPIVIINTNGGTIVDDPKILVKISIIDNGVGQRNNVTDVPNIYNGMAGIEIRGSSSQMFPKKQYGIELKTADGEDDNDTALFGLPKESDWILFAPYNDKTLMRDALAYHLGRSIGDYASRSRYCELVLNNEYMGVYLLLEKVKRGKDRVNINKIEKQDITGDKLTGGYILKIDKTTGGDEGGFVSTHKPPGGKSQTTYFQWEYPKAEDLVAQQKTYIKDYVTKFEDVLASDNYDHPTEGWTKYADMNSFIDYLIMNELTKNPDAYRLSTFMHKKRDSEGGKLFMGPIWDYNLGFGNVNYCTQGNSTGLVIDFNSICPEDGWLIPFWWQKLWSDDAFRMKLSERWTSLRSNQFATDAVLDYVDSISTLLNAEAQQRNFRKWPVLGQYVWPNYKYDLATYNAEVSWLRSWVNDRLTYLDGVFGYSITGVGESIPKGFLVHAYPNPFENEITFDYEIPAAGSTKLEVFDIMGKKISTLVDSQPGPGKYSAKVSINTSPGIYVYRVSSSDGHVVTGKVVRK